jgi:hypothetical protein
MRESWRKPTGGEDTRSKIRGIEDKAEYESIRDEFYEWDGWYHTKACEMRCRCEWGMRC